MENCEVTDIDFEDGHGITARTLYLKRRVEDTDDTGENGEAVKDSYVFETVQLRRTISVS